MAQFLIGIVLAINLFVPLKWYLAPLVDAEVDERFTWRMFSAFSMRRTQIYLTEEIRVEGQLVEREIELPTIMQPAWAELLQTYHQPALIRRVLKRHCQCTAAESATFTRTGKWSDGTGIEPTVIRFEREIPR